MKSSYSVMGVMAGSSMDGLDIAQVHLKREKEDWHFEIVNAVTVAYTESIFSSLKYAPERSESELKELDLNFGEWIGERLNEFQKGSTINSELIAVHGHTVIHDPQKGISWQLGNGEAIASKTRTTTVTDFRTADVQQGGEGAPLVPIGDFTLFKQFDACLNLGGIANISYQANKTAWDICPCNQVLNYYANKLGVEYDDQGLLAQKGRVDDSFISRILEIDFFSRVPPKSLPNHFIPKEILDSVPPKDGLRSYARLIASQLEKELSFNELTTRRKLLVTGGGAFNTFLIEEIKNRLDAWEVIVPDKSLISFKESLVFALMGLLRWLDEINVLSSVTGGLKDISSGVIHLPK